jgi:hypothetical protein
MSGYEYWTVVPDLVFSLKSLAFRSLPANLLPLLVVGQDRRHRPVGQDILLGNVDRLDPDAGVNRWSTRCAGAHGEHQAWQQQPRARPY